MIGLCQKRNVLQPESSVTLNQSRNDIASVPVYDVPCHLGAVIIRCASNGNLFTRYLPIQSRPIDLKHRCVCFQIQSQYIDFFCGADYVIGEVTMDKNGVGSGSQADVETLVIIRGEAKQVFVKKLVCNKSALVGQRLRIVKHIITDTQHRFVTLTFDLDIGLSHDALRRTSYGIKSWMPSKQ